MKKLVPCFFLLSFVLCFVACTKSGSGNNNNSNNNNNSTPAVVPTVSTDDISAITSNSASCGGDITADGGATVTFRGVCWSTTSNPTISGSKTNDGTGRGTFASTLTGLASATTYYVKAYATNSAGTAYGKEVSFTTAPPSPTSPWQAKWSGDNASQRGVFGMFAPDSMNCYGVMYDANVLVNLQGELTITHDGGATWQKVIVPGMTNNNIWGVCTSSTPNTVHVIAANYISGGGSVFRSEDGGTTWQQEAINAFADPTSFPDEIRFFDSQNGVIFGDPVGGYFEIYTTSDGGNTWTRVPSNNIPPLAAPNEEGFAYYTDVYQNTMWVITTLKGSNAAMVPSRLFESDDMGHTWYVKNPSMVFANTIYTGDGSIKFRNASVGLYKNNQVLYRTNDGGATWNVVNYTGTWFSYDLDNVPGKDGWWVSTGGDSNFPSNSGNGHGSSISYDDGNSWTTLDTGINHTVVYLTSPTSGFSGGITSGNGNDGVFVYHPH